MSEKKEVALVDPKEFGLNKEESTGIAEAFQQVNSDLREIQKEYDRIIALPINDDTAKFAHELAKKAKKKPMQT